MGLIRARRRVGLRAMELTPPTRFFSLREANALVPTLQETFVRARALRDRLAGVQSELAAAGHPSSGTKLEVDEAAPPHIQALQRRGQSLLQELLGILREVSE